jgi:alpha-beta hydrolase superfamily lysophospholipase
MGGLITLDYLTQDGPSRVQSATLSNPALGVAIEVPRLKHMASEVLKTFWPTMTLNNEVRYERLSRDPAKVANYSRDPLRHSKISAPLYLGMLETMKDVQRKPESLTTPVFFQISGKDQIVSAQASLDYFKSLTCPKKLKIYEESYHEVYNDLDQKEAIDDLAQFLGEFQK